MRDMKLTLTLYYIISIPVAILIVFSILIAESNFVFQFYLAFLVLIVFLIVVVVLLQLLANKHLKKMRDFLFEKCDPEEYIKVYHKKMRKNAILTKFDISLGYIHLGDYDATISLIQSISLNTKLKRKMHSYLYFNHLFVCYLRKGDFVSAQQCLDDMKSFLPKNITISDQQRYYYRYDCLVKQYDLNIAQGNYDGALQFLATLPPAEDMLESISRNYKLAQIYAGLGNPSAAREAANFVIANGNKTVFVSLAQKLLAEIE